MDLITAFLAHHADTEDGVPPESRKQALMVCIRACIERNLGPRAVTRRSRRLPPHLRAVPAPAVPAAGRHRKCVDPAARLEGCRRDLADPQMSDKPIGFLAARWGFVHASEFTRAFRNAYGIPPSAYRQEVLHSEQCTRPPTASIRDDTI
jgi:hypothetical protein